MRRGEHRELVHRPGAWRDRLLFGSARLQIREREVDDALSVAFGASRYGECRRMIAIARDPTSHVRGIHT